MKSTDFDGRKLLNGASPLSKILLDDNGSTLSLETPNHLTTEAFKTDVATGQLEPIKNIGTDASISLAESINGDFDNDGNLDLVVRSGADFRIYLGNGDGTFASAITVEAGADALDIRLEDINQDGNLDLTGIGGANDLYFYLGDGEGVFTFSQSIDEAVGPRNYTELRFADVNGDNILDVINATTINTLEYRAGNGDGTFGGFVNIDAANTTSDHFQIFDADGDGDIDLVVADNNTQNNYVIYENDGTGAFSRGLEFGSSIVGTGRSLSVGDFDEDGINDIVTNDIFSLDLFIGKSKEVAALSKINVNNETNASELIHVVDDTLNLLINNRSEVNTLLSRMDQSRLTNLVQQESLSSAKSVIEDTDFALETAELVKNQVLQQAQIAMQAQANIQLQVVLGLFNFS